MKTTKQSRCLSDKNQDSLASLAMTFGDGGESLAYVDSSLLVGGKMPRCMA